MYGPITGNIANRLSSDPSSSFQGLGSYPRFQVPGSPQSPPELAPGQVSHNPQTVLRFQVQIPGFQLLSQIPHAGLSIKQ